MNNNTIVIVDDDADDANFLINALKEMGVMNGFRRFDSPLPALTYLRETREVPFIIISDINMPKMNGLAFKRLLNEDKSLNQKNVPFVFLSTSTSNCYIKEAMNLSVQGYFQKPEDINSMNEIAKAIIEYWKHCKLQPLLTD